MPTHLPCSMPRARRPRTSPTPTMRRGHAPTWSCRQRPIAKNTARLQGRRARQGRPSRVHIHLDQRRLSTSLDRAPEGGWSARHTLTGMSWSRSDLYPSSGHESSGVPDLLNDPGRNRGPSRAIARLASSLLRETNCRLFGSGLFLAVGTGDSFVAWLEAYASPDFSFSSSFLAFFSTCRCAADYVILALS